MTTKAGKWTVAETDAGVRLDRFLAGILLDESRSRIQNWIRRGELLVNGRVEKTGYVVRPGDELALSVSEEPPDGAPRPEAIPLNILFEDPHLAVVDKPAGMVCHAGAGVHSGTLVNALLHHFGTITGGDPQRPGIVHRLDKLTSGLLVVARDPVTHRQLSAQFKGRTVRKEYLALVYGCPSPAAASLDWPLGRDTRDRKKISTRSRRTRPAVTHYRLEKDFGAVSLLRIRIETGRTHQIRVHMARKGHPVVGDLTYGGRRGSSLRDPALRAAVESLGRFFLHACRLEFEHPRTGQRVSFESPLPPELQSFLSLL